MPKTFVKDLKDRDQVDSLFLVKTKSTPLSKNGKPYLALMIGDRTGAIEGRMWDNVENVVNTFQIDDFVKIKGIINLYQKRKQLVISEITKISRAEINAADFLPCSKQDVDVMFKNLLTIINGMKNKYLRQLVLSTLEDPEIQPKYLKCPAARTIHHNWVGGLLEHTLSICKVMVFLAAHYENIDLDLLLVGAIFHDIGKIWELSFETNISYTDVGRLVGHLVLGSELIEKKASQISGFPDELKMICKHLVLSHHGKYEYGSPKRPKILEAYIVSAIDDFDSKVSALQSFIQIEKGRAETKESIWTGHNSVFDRYFFIPKGESEINLEEVFTEPVLDFE